MPFALDLAGGNKIQMEGNHVWEYDKTAAGAFYFYECGIHCEGPHALSKKWTVKQGERM